MLLKFGFSDLVKPSVEPLFELSIPDIPFRIVPVLAVVTLGMVKVLHPCFVKSSLGSEDLPLP
jgi:hypothetical protein